MSSEPPDRTLGEGDPGDDIFRRYRYQSTYAAVLAVDILRDDSRVAEVFCEHHDDILMKLTNDRFHAIQVKTQQPGGLPFKSDDEPIQKALGKFLEHEMRFADHFERYTIATNHQFFRDNDNSKSLFFLSEKAREAEGSEPDEINSKLSRFINGFLRSFNNRQRGKESSIHAQLLEVLCKLYLDDDLPKLTRIHRELRDVIAASREKYGASTLAELDRAAHALSAYTVDASSRFDAEATRSYLSLSEDPVAEAMQRIIESKRIDSETVERIIDTEIPKWTSLAAAQPIDPQTLPGDLTTAEKKMTAGGLSATTVAAARDWYASAQHIQREWASKYGEVEAVKRYNHVATAVQTVSAHAHEAVRQHGEPYGPQMLEEIKTGLSHRRESGTQFFDCDEEHLLGHAVIRTDQCKTWWSEPFELARGA